MALKNKCVYLYLGLVDYQSAWDLQKMLAQLRLQKRIPDILLLLQHPHTITVGKSGKKEHLVADDVFLSEHDIVLKEVDRGGDVTYHGPGQLIGYPVLDLSAVKPDVIWYLRQLEESIIRTLQDYQIMAERKPKYTGVWVNEEKIAAIGVKISHWITTHGFALNVSTNLNYFNTIIPCGIRNKSVTSVRKVLNRGVAVEEIIPKYVNQFSKVFQLKMLPYNHYTWHDLTVLLENFSEKVVSQKEVVKNGKEQDNKKMMV